MTNHDNLKDIRELAFVLSGFCNMAEDCAKECPLFDDCPGDYPTKLGFTSLSYKTKRVYASLDEWIAWLNRKYGGNDNDKP